jgi:lipoprotein-anchoring transpeptidase ErfK/SrfK
MAEQAATSTQVTKRKIVVSLPKHTITVFEDDNPVRTIASFSTGRQGHLTPLLDHGKLDPKRRELMHYSHTYKDSHGKPAAMPYALFFDHGSGCAFHAGDPHVESHGCIHLEKPDAEWLFDWAGKYEIGLQILGPNPHALPAAHA